jgi:thioredoxin-related protein
LKRIALLAVVALLAVPRADAAIWLKSLAAAQKQAKADNAIIFVDLFADWCGWCKQLEQQVFPSEAFQKATKNYVLLRLNTEDGGDGTTLSQRYQVTSLPTSVLMTHDGMVVGLIKGFLPADRMAMLIGEQEKQWGEFNKRVAKENSLGSDYQKRLDLARDFRNHFAFDKSTVRFKKLATDPKTPAAIRDQAYFDLAVTLFLDKKFDDSMKWINHFAKVQSAGESYERSRLLAAEIYANQGNFLAAANELRGFKTKFPKSAFLSQVDFMLPQIERRLSSSQVQ